jgi:hypothetical protein
MTPIVLPARVRSRSTEQPTSYVLLRLALCLLRVNINQPSPLCVGLLQRAERRPLRVGGLASPGALVQLAHSLLTWADPIGWPFLRRPEALIRVWGWFQAIESNLTSLNGAFNSLTDVGGLISIGVRRTLSPAWLSRSTFFFISNAQGQPQLQSIDNSFTSLQSVGSIILVRHPVPPISSYKRAMSC